jgi:anti-sigma B factor antagonist
MTQAESRLKIVCHGEVTEVEFLDKNILDETNIQHIGAEISQLIEDAAIPRLLISFREVDHLSSAALGTLITLNNRVADRKGRLCLACIQGQILEVFRITKLDQIFEIYESTSDALKAMA